MKQRATILLLLISFSMFAKHLVPGYHFKEGQKYDYEVEREQNMQFTIGEQPKSAYQINQYRISLEVKSYDKDFSVLMVKLQSYRLHVFENEEPKNLEEVPLNAVDSLIKKHILNRTYFVRIDRFGNVLNITFPNFDIDPFEMDSVKFNALMEFSEKQNVVSLLSEVLIVYPRNTVSRDDTWNNIVAFDGGIPILMNATMQIANKKNTLLRIDGKIYANTELVNESLFGLLSTNKLGTGTGIAELNSKTGLQINKEVNYTMNGEFLINQQAVSLQNKIHIRVKEFTR